MRRSMLILGVFLIFLSLILLTISQASTGVIERWQTIQETGADPPNEELSIQGELMEEDEFRTYFYVQLKEPSQGWTPIDVGVVMVNLTEPSGNIVSLPETLIGVYRGYPYPEEIPKGVANATGTYKVYAKAIGMIDLITLRLEKFEIEEKRPYSILLFFGVPVGIVGVASSVFGARSSKGVTKGLRSRKQTSRR